MQLSRLSTNSAWLLFSRVGAQLGLAIFTILLARGLGSAIFGEYAFIASLTVVGNVLTTFGTDMLLIREIASNDDLSSLSSALLIQILISVLFIGAVLLGSAIIPAPDRAAGSALRIYSLSMLPLAFYTVFTTALRGRQHMLAYAALNLVLVLMQVLAAAWLLWKHGDIVLLAVLLLVVQIAAATLAGILCAVRIPDLRRAAAFSISRVPPLLQASAPIALLGILGVIYQRFTLLALPSLAGASATGWFSAAARLVEAAKLGHLAVLTALYPMMAKASDTGDSSWARGFRIPGLTLLVGALAASLGVDLLAGVLIPLLFGAQYIAAIPLVRILSWILIPYTVNSFLTLGLLVSGEERGIARALAASILTLLILTAWWVPVSGSAGAAWAALVAELAQSIALLLEDSRGIGIMEALLRRENPAGINS